MNKKSKSISLLLPVALSTALLGAACDGGEDPQRDLYSNRQECTAVSVEKLTA